MKEKTMNDDKELKDQMIETMLNDLGIDCISYSPATAENAPYWLLEMCDKLIRAGWMKP